MPVSIKESVRLTRAYSNFFKFPLEPKEVHRWLISSKKTSPSQIKRYISPLGSKDQKLRQQLTKISEKKQEKLKPLINLLSFFPNLKMVAITGSVAVKNASKSADIDLMLIFSANTLWISRPFLIFICRLFFPLRQPLDNHQPDSFCLNLWLDTLSLSVPREKQNLYTAHEVLQVVPILNRDNAYERFITSNSWSRKFLANAYSEITSLFKFRSKVSFPNKKILSSCLFPLNFCLFFIQYLYMRSKITREHITPHAAYFHPRDFGNQITQAILRQ